MAADTPVQAGEMFSVLHVDEKHGLALLTRQLDGKSYIFTTTPTVLENLSALALAARRVVDCTHGVVGGEPLAALLARLEDHLEAAEADGDALDLLETRAPKPTIAP